MPAPAFAIGDRVSLHPIEEGDHEFLQRGRNHPSTRVPLTNTLIRTTGDVADRVEDADHHYLVCAPEERDSGSDGGDGADAPERDGQVDAPESGGQFDVPERDGQADRERVGVVAFTRTGGPPRAATLMYWIAPDHRQRGYATEAASLLLDYGFRECGFHRVRAHTLVSNDASIAALESLGFEREGRLRDEAFVDGDTVDVHQYGLLADEWLD